MGYNVSDSLSTAGALSALKQALKNRKYHHEPLIHHSDRGLQYCSNDYQRLLKKYHVTCSMTESYDPYANAVAERINGILKQEFLNHTQVTDIRIMRELVKNSIEIYNDCRPHYSCFMKTPNQMHLQNQIKIRTYKKSIPIAQNGS